MSEKRTFGLKSIKIGEIAADGGMGTSLSVLGVTDEGSATFTKAEDTTKEFFCEESDDPIETVTKKGITSLEWSIVDFSPVTLVKVLGGTVDTTVPATPVWEAPDSAAVIEKSIEFITKTDVKVQIVRAKISASMDWKLGKEAIGVVKIKATVMMPTKAGTKSYSIS